MGEKESNNEDKESHDYLVHRRRTTKEQIISHIVNGLEFALDDAVDLLEYQKLRYEKSFEKKEKVDGSSFELEIKLRFRTPG